MSLLGLDIGTTGCKAIVFRPDGSIVGRASREYPVCTPHRNWAEQDAERVFQLAWEAVQEAVAIAARDPLTEASSPASFDCVKAMALSVQGEAILPVDREGRALRPAILGMDMRTVEENRWLAERFGPDILFRRTGMPLHTVNTLPKLLWLKNHEPETWTRAHEFLLYEDFFLRRLTGEATISHCLASRTQMYDIASRDWAHDILSECGIGEKRLARLGPDGGGIVGTLRHDLARELDVRGDIVVASGGHDQACAALGSGIIEAGLAMVSTGTAEVVEVAMNAPALSETLRRGSISVYRHVVPELYLAMTLNHSGGMVLRWFRDRFCKRECEAGTASGQDAYDSMLAGAPAGPTPLLVLPHFSGSGTPTLDTSSKGAILGLTFGADRPMLAKAILEGLTFELRGNLDLLKEGGIAIRELRAVGGGARSDLWLQLKADICGIPLRVPHVTEAACLGAAILAGTAAGIYSNLRSAVEQTVFSHKYIQPRAESGAAYETRYRLYRQLYPTLIPLLRQL